MTDFEHLQDMGVPVLTKEALTKTELAVAAAQTNANPTEAQKESGSYRKGKVEWKGLTISIETAKGEVRSGTSKTGKAWAITMKDHYGFINGARSGADGDEIDVFLNDANLDSEVVFVVNQNKADGSFDEHKCVIGCVAEDDARKTYLRNYSAGWKGLGSVKAMTLPDFKRWIRSRPEKRAADAKPEPLPYRDRAEMYALKDGKLFGGLFSHGGFGVFGGGIDPGEDGATAAAREFQEETGWSVTNPRPLPFDPHTLDWTPPFDDPKLAERAKQFRGSRTHYYAGDLGEQIPDAKIDELGRSGVGLYDLDDAASKAEQPGLSETLAAANKRRVEILKHLKALGLPEKTAETKEEFWKRNAEGKERSKDSKLGHVRDGYIPCGGCQYRYHEMPEDETCPTCGYKLGVRLRGRTKKANSEIENYRPKLLLVKRAASDDDTPFTVAVDLDGTLAEKEVPFNPASIGAPRPRAVAWVRRFKKAGARIIIFTVRGTETLVADWLAEHDVPYAFINENPDQPEGASGKVIADVYWDDRAYNAEDPDEFGPEILRRIDGTTLLDILEKSHDDEGKADTGEGGGD